MANRNWRSGGYQTFNQILTPMSYYQQPNIPYQSERKTYGGSAARGGGYREDNYKRERKDFQSNRRDRISPIKRRSPPSYQRSHETHGNAIRKDPKKSSHGGGRYEVKAPRLTFDIKDLSTTSLKFRYPKIYAPCDFFHAHMSAQETFPLYRPMKLGNRCEFQVLSKEVEVTDVEVTDAEPDDADYKYSAKVMLMSSPLLPELYKSACHLSGSNEPKLSVIKNIKFLVGSKGKNEPMAIGGPWSPSLDGSDPEEDPYVLINTAIRTCKALTGIDLSGCKKWYKFLDIQYYRQSLRMDEGVEIKPEDEEVEHERVEVVSIFIPDIWSCEPTEAEWIEIKSKYEQKLNSLINPTIVEEIPVEEIKVATEDKMDEVIEEKVEEAIEKSEEIVEKADGTADVDLNQMKVTELRAELTARGLEPKGLKLQLIQRLQDAIDNEKRKAEVKTDLKVEDKPVEVAVNKEIEVMKTVISTTQLPEKEQKRLEKLYKMNDRPAILVQPNKVLHDGKFECMVTSLDSLLDFRGDNQKEHSFEISLFAEQFNEMLQRDAAFTIYKSVINLPDLVKENVEPDVKKTKLEQSNEPRKSKVIVDINLYFAFSVFDSDNSGCFRDHELENILHCIGLNLSRSQVKKLLAKIPSKKGNIFYKDVVEREAIEGSPEDIATLRTNEGGKIDILIELAQGNKSFFDEADTHTLAQRSGSLSLLDKINTVESKKLDYGLQLSLMNAELQKLKAAEVGSGDVELHLRENIKKIQDKLAIEKETLAKLSEVAAVYHGLLISARDNMDTSIKSINGQFDLEKELADAIKAKEEAAAKAKEEAAAKAREEAAALAREEAAKAKEEADKAKEEADKAKEADMAEADILMEVNDDTKEVDEVA